MRNAAGEKLLDVDEGQLAAESLIVLCADLSERTHMHTSRNAFSDRANEVAGS